MLECKGNILQMLKEQGGLIHAFSTKKVGFLWHWSLPSSCMCGVLFSVCQLASVDILSQLHIHLPFPPLFFSQIQLLTGGYPSLVFVFWHLFVLPALPELTTFVD